MQDRTYAIAFLLVLAIICLGAYVAISTVLFSPRVPTISFGTPTPPSLPQMTPSPTLPLFPTPTSPPFLVTPVAPTPTPLPPATPTPSASPTPTPEPSPTGPTPTPAPPTPVGGFLYQVLSGEKTECGQAVAYIRGTVCDAQGNGEAGVRVRLYNDWEPDRITETKGAAIDIGQYNFVMGPSSGPYRLEIVDSVGRPLSLPYNVDHKAGCTVYVDWQAMK
jgi:hypothetical protein